MIPVLHRNFIDKALDYFKNDSRIEGIAAGGSYIMGEMDAPEDIGKLKRTVAEHDKQSCINAVKTLMDFYIQLRERFEPDGFTKHTEAQKYVIEYLLSMEE